MLKIREEGPGDAGAGRRIHDAAFGGTDESRIVDAFSPVIIEDSRFTRIDHQIS